MAGARGKGVAEAGRLVGVGERSVFRWLGWYRADGTDGVLRRVPGRGALLERIGRGELRA